ncbi:uncharacterized protein JCM10292_004551 [Rhodotorula paludigena]|uniref:uncharacterized protein n=1 Tax=Rhodotorula paludigena TaxID=86838 RepID=UPI00316DDB16
MACTSPFSSPLGPLHHADPGTASSHNIFALFRTSSSSSSKEAKAAPRPAKRNKKELLISSPVLQSTTNLSVAAPSYTDATQAFSAPRPFRSSADHFPLDSEDPRCASPPPPYRFSASSVDLTRRDSFLSSVPPIDMALVPGEEVEKRLQRWDTERQLCQQRELIEVDARMAHALEQIGL